jgi:hypothetical protein
LFGSVLNELSVKPVLGELSSMFVVVSTEFISVLTTFKLEFSESVVSFLVEVIMFVTSISLATIYSLLFNSELEVFVTTMLPITINPTILATNHIDL